MARKSTSGVIKNYTESSSKYMNIEKKSVLEIIQDINAEDSLVARAVKKVLPQIEKLIQATLKKMKAGGRLFYIGAGTSGRLGVVDASECPPTFGVDYNTVIGIIAGGDRAFIQAVEFAEDDMQQAWKDLMKHKINASDMVIGLSASGTTPYVLGGLQACRKNKISTACIVCNPHSSIAAEAKFPIEVIVGAEYLSGSSRMKAGTAQKLILNTISTTVMAKMGRVKGNRMVDMQLANHKLIDRGVKMVLESLPHLSYEEVKRHLLKYKNVRRTIEALQA